MQTLARRVGLLDGVVFSGGEATIDVRLDDAIAQVRGLGLQTGLHTAGVYPERLAALLPGIDLVGFDVKTGFRDYDALTGRRRSGSAARRALGYLLASGVACELRTTYHLNLIDDTALLGTARALKALGARHWVLQRWHPFDGSSAELASQWHWPDEQLLKLLHAEGPALTMR